MHSIVWRLVRTEQKKEKKRKKKHNNPDINDDNWCLCGRLYLFAYLVVYHTFFLFVVFVYLFKEEKKTFFFRSASFSASE